MIVYCQLFALQVVELQNRLSEESKKADKMEFEYKRLKEKVDSLQKEKDVRRYQLLFISLVVKAILFVNCSVQFYLIFSVFFIGYVKCLVCLHLNPL